MFCGKAYSFFASQKHTIQITGIQMVAVVLKIIQKKYYLKHLFPILA